MQIFFSGVDLKEGFEILEPEHRHDRLVRGRRVDRPSGWALFHHMKGQPIRCHFCGCQADQWVAEKGKKDKVGHPVLNLYATKHCLPVMMTRDHIIPKSLGGVDDVANLRPACAPCNEERGNEVLPEVIRFAQEHPELVSEERIIKGKKHLQEALAQAIKHGQLEEVARLIKPFIAMGYL